MSETLVNLTIDGKAVAAPRGMNLVEASKLAGVEVPHYCYHQRLSIAGNCRMCLVDVGMPKLKPDRTWETGPDGKPVIVFGPKLVIACNTPVAEGMVVHTRSPKVVKAREGVMEFLLVNHPLDCPICDQAGECRLQEFAMDYGRAGSRFREQKERKPKQVKLGAKIVLDDERCILCSRCIRFMREVAGQDCLGFVQRGSRSYLTCYPGQEPNTNYDLNITDICPVGALTSTDFRFRQRVWFLRETRSVCAGCSRGCNILIGSREEKVLRFTPRDNDAVNLSWMCDLGRLSYRAIHDEKRLKAPRVDGAEVEWAAALEAAAARLRAVRKGGGRIAVIGSARATTEEQFLLRRIAAALEADLMDCVPAPGDADRLLLTADRTPNMRGAQVNGLAANPPGSKLAAIAAAIGQGAVQGLLVLNDDPTAHGVAADLLARLKALVAIDAASGAATAKAQVVLPGAHFAEKDGTFINVDGRVQRIRAAVRSPGDARPDWQILAGLLARLGGPAFTTVEAVFSAMAQDVPACRGLDWAALGDQGVPLPGGGGVA